MWKRTGPDDHRHIAKTTDEPAVKWEWNEVWPEGGRQQGSNRDLRFGTVALPAELYPIDAVDTMPCTEFKCKTPKNLICNCIQ